MTGPKTKAAAILTAFALIGGAAPVRAQNLDAVVVMAAEDQAFMAWFEALLKKVSADPKYNRLPLDTEEQSKEFEVKLYEAFRKTISTAEFASWAEQKYPGHRYEVGVISGALPH